VFKAQTFFLGTPKEKTAGFLSGHSFLIFLAGNVNKKCYTLMIDNMVHSPVRDYVVRHQILTNRLDTPSYIKFDKL